MNKKLRLGLHFTFRGNVSLYDTISHKTYISMEKVISKEIQKVSKVMPSVLVRRNCPRAEINNYVLQRKICSEEWFLYPEEGSSKLMRNSGTYLPHYISQDTVILVYLNISMTCVGQMSLQATSKQTSVLAPIISHIASSTQTNVNYVRWPCFPEFWKLKIQACWNVRSCWLLNTLKIGGYDDPLEPSSLPMLLWDQLSPSSGYTFTKWTYLEEEGIMFHRNTGIFRYPYVVIPEQRANNFTTSEIFTTVSFTKVPYFLEIYFQTKCHTIYTVHRRLFLASHTFISKQRWLHGVVQWQKLGLSVTSRLENLSNS